MIITLENALLRAEVNTHGGAIESVVDKRSGRDHCWTYDPQLWPRRTSICFPICSLLRGGAYTHEGVRYEMPIHGFMRDCEFAVVSRKDDCVVMAFEANDFTRASYPFDFRFELEERLEEDTLVVDYRVTNTGSGVLPFSVGSHYTYTMPAPQKDCFFRFTAPQNARGLVLQGGVVQGKGEDAFGGASQLSLDGLFETSSKIFETADFDTDHIAIGTAEGDFTRVAYTGFPYTVLWGPKGSDAPFVCIEAWAGMADYEGRSSEITQKVGIQLAKPGETLCFQQRITAL